MINYPFYQVNKSANAKDERIVDSFSKEDLYHEQKINPKPGLEIGRHTTQGGDAEGHI